MDGWMICYFTSFSTVFLDDDNEKLCAGELHLRSRKFLLKQGSNLVYKIRRTELNPLSPGALRRNS